MIGILKGLVMNFDQSLLTFKAGESKFESYENFLFRLLFS